MCPRKDDWFGELFAGLDPDNWRWEWHGRGGKRRRRGAGGPMFESGEIKFVVLRLLREKPRHGYEIIKELEEQFAGFYSPSPGTVYPTLQMLEDQGYVRAVETDGKKVYHITAEGEAFLETNRTTIDDILDRVRATLREVCGGARGEVNEAFARLARVVYRDAWRRAADDPATRRIVEVLNRAAADIEALRGQPATERSAS